MVTMKETITAYFPLHNIVRVSSSSLLSIVDQGLLSAINFSIGLFLIHFAGKEQYGLYSLAYGVITLVIGIAGALIVTPMTVSYTDRPVEQRHLYCLSVLIGQQCVVLPLLGLALVVIGVLHLCGALTWPMASFAAVIATASVGGMLWEFVRRYHYLNLQPTQALSLDIYYASIVMAGFSIVVSMSVSDLHWWGVVIYGLATLVVGIYAFAGMNFSTRTALVDINKTLKESWHLGRWALGGVFVTWVQTQSFAYFLAIFSDLGRVADANAARLLLAPLMLVNTGLNNILLPRLVRMRSQNHIEDTEELAHQFMWGLIGIFVVYTMLVLLLKEKLILIVLGETYKEVGLLVVAWAVVNLLTALRGISSLLLQTFKRFQVITLANAGSALVVVGITWPLIYYCGTLGSIMALGVGELVLAVLLRREFARVRQQHPN